ncbi:MAG TPA: hypothetical protein DEP42_06115 [Ruminococcaceae bacterium]|nr:hypothetical protein [Oscillospiraceae bacterium]
MTHCPACGNKMISQESFCKNCGLEVEKQNIITTQKSREYNVLPYFIWSLLLFLCFNPFGTPLAFVSTFFCVDAKKQNAPQSIKTIRLLRVLSTIITIATFIYNYIALKSIR